ncbi:hypothetical protein BDQ17DRAFT_1429725 [Cyathus striatus]|nr:hypothetical protein BDQ17DRAFT_1429725 [Cyathus striatus]
MPPISTGRILVTGANGYIGTWLVRSLLAQNYAVRGVVRTPDKAKSLERYFRRYGGKFECAVVDDIVKNGAFNEVDDPDAYIQPAIGGTLGLLQSALQFGDWNETAVKEVERLGAKAGVGRSMLLLRLWLSVVRVSFYLFVGRGVDEVVPIAAWNFYGGVKDEVGWDFVSIVPCTVYGPTLLDPATPSHLNASLSWFYNAVVDSSKLKKESELKDAKGDAGGERIVVCAGSNSWQEWTQANANVLVDVANALNPSPPLSDPLPKGFPGLERRQLIKFDTSKSERILGMKYRSMEETARDVLFDFVSRGW